MTDARPGRHRDLQNADYAEWRQFLRTTDTWSRSDIERYQLEAIQRLVARASTQTTGYRSLFDNAGVGPGDIATLADVRRLPYVTKEMLRDSLAAYTATTEGCDYVTTGGSTGIPFGMYRTPRAFARELASKAHQYERRGWQEGDPQLVLRGLPIDTPDHTALVDDLNELRCSSYHLVPDTMDGYVAAARAYEPLWLRCYPSAGCLFARHVLETGQSIPSLRGILCASENLLPEQESLLRAAFGVPVFSHYGHYELAALAGFCEHTSRYHVLPQYGYVELIGTDGLPVTTAGGVGEIVATSFLMDATLFVRYRTRDLAVYSADHCESCHRPHQVWERVEGRLQEFVLSATGRLISMTAMNMHTPVFDPLRQFQFYQASPGEVEFRYVPRAEGVEAPALDAMRTALGHKLGADIRLSFRQVDDLPPTVRGKRRFLIQDLPIETLHGLASGHLHG